MLRREYNITYGQKEKEIVLIIDGKNYQLKFNDAILNFSDSELDELTEFLHIHNFDASMQEDILKIINENEQHEIREDINYLLVDLEQNLEETDHRLIQKFLELKQRLSNFEKKTAIDIDAYEEFEDEFDQN